MTILNEDNTVAIGKTGKVRLGEESNPSTLETLAEILYSSYCKSVGGKAFNGDPLPNWNEFSADPNKAKQVFGWRVAALEALDFAASDPQI